jgi:hypothetical protein
MSNMRTDYFAPKIDYEAPQHVRDVIASLGRTEDVKFSPSNRRLAVAGFFRNKITIFDVSIADSGNSKTVALTGVAEISSADLKWPHGLVFLDDNKVLVANRIGNACIFELPAGELKDRNLAPVAVIHSDIIRTPGSLAVTDKGRDLYEALVVNNYGNSVSRHLLDLSSGCSTTSNEVLLTKCLDVPDGICVSSDAQWIAVSNHNSHSVFLYKNNSSLGESSLPDGILRYSIYPHGLRFTTDGRFILLADSGSPFVHIYERDKAGWHGVRSPLLSMRVLSDEDLSGAPHDYENAGPKGIDVNNAMSVFVTTCHYQPLAFFDLTAALEDAAANFSDTPNGRLPENWLRDKHAREINYELNLHGIAKTELGALTNSRSWRITAPLRWVNSVLSGRAALN